MNRFPEKTQYQQRLSPPYVSFNTFKTLLDWLRVEGVPLKLDRSFWHDKFMLKGKLENLDIPSMMVWGEDDLFAPVELGYELEKLLPNIQFKYASNAGHQVQTDQPELVAQMATDFFLT